MNSVFAVAIAAFLLTFSYLIWETNNDDEKEMCRRRHPSRAR